MSDIHDWENDVKGTYTLAKHFENMYNVCVLLVCSF